MEEKKRKILFVDDEPNVLRGLRRMLYSMRNKWDVDFATSGHNALEIMEEAPFDVIVTDMRMPEMDGAQLLDKVIELYPSTIRFVLSGQSQEEVIFRSVGPAHQFLSKPCDAETIKKTIQASLSLRDDMSNEKIRKIVSKVKSLPSLPSIYIEVTNELKKENSSMHSVAEIIEHDIGMSSKILQLVNSSFFGIPNHITDIAQAASFLGIDVIRSLVLSVGTFSQFKVSPNYENTLAGLINHSLMVGACAKEIVKMEGGEPKNEEDVFAAGLLHKIGEVIFMSYMPKEYRSIHTEMTKENMSLADAEEKELGITYAEAGAYLLGIWGLQDVITEAIAYQLKPSKCARKDNIALTALHSACALLEEIDASSEEQNATPAKIDMSYIESVGKTDKIQKWRDICLKEYEEKHP